MAWITFWLSAAACGLAAVFASYHARREEEATIRLGIEKGAITDAAGIAQARARKGVPWPARLIVVGFIHLFAALGAAVFAAAMSTFEPESVAPLLGIAGFTGVVALGFMIGGVWLRREVRRVND